MTTDPSYEPELGQACFGQPTEEFALADWVESMFQGLLRQLELAYWNLKQSEWHDYEPADFGPVHVRPYSWGDEDAGPNFWHDGHPQRIRWYKHPGRGMSCSVAYTEAQWIEWHNAVFSAIRQADDEHLRSLGVVA